MDSNALQALIDGDSPAWGQFYSDVSPLIRNVCAAESLGLSNEDLDDLVQIVCEKLIDNDCAGLRMFDPDLDIAPYVVAIALNAARDMAKKASRWREIPVGGTHELEMIEAQQQYTEFNGGGY